MAVNYDLSGKVAVVTGSGRHAGLGEAMAKRLAECGAKLVITDIGETKGDIAPEHGVGQKAEMDQIVDEIKAAGGEASGFVCDVMEEQQVADLVQFAVDTYGRLDIMVNNAGIGYLFGPLLDMKQDFWDAVLNVNLRGPFFGIKHAGKQMIKQGGGGRIINIASQAAKSGHAQAGAYTASKHGLVGLTRTAAKELAEHQITVNAICPNHVTTGLGAWQNEFMSKARGQTMDEYMAAMRARIPLGRPGLVDDTANACAFLCSDEASYITSEAMNVSGGEEYH